MTNMGGENLLKRLLGGFLNHQENWTMVFRTMHLKRMLQIRLQNWAGKERTFASVRTGILIVLATAATDM